MTEAAFCSVPASAFTADGDVVPNRSNVAWMKSEFGLTAKELQIMHYLARGNTPQQIADLTNNSTHTIRTHMNSIYKKTRVNHIVGLMALIIAGPTNKSL